MYVDASSYDNLRSIASVTDGLKNSGRKVLSTVIDKSINKEVKVSRLKSTVSEHTEYLHGEDNLASVIVNMARRYTGSNNLPLMKDQGNFGKRFINEASADRYISTAGEKYLQYIYPKVDNNILIEQEFEGDKIEPRFFIPIIPMLLVNGSPNAISVGFAQNILPRPVKQIIAMVEKYLNTGVVKVPKPGWEGFKGLVKQGADKKKWVVYGRFTKVNSTTLEITELPVGIELKAYTDILDTLQDNKVITSYKDLSDNGVFKFRVRTSRKFLEMTDDEIAETLKLKDSGRRFVENYTLLGADNRIDVCETPEEIFEKYAEIRLEYYKLRKEFLIANTIKELKILASRYFFIKMVTEDKIIINKRSKVDVIEQIESFDKIQPDEEGKYDFLLRMPIYSLTEEKMDELLTEIKDKKFLLDGYKESDPKNFWLEDLEILKANLK
jgi:DNA topoisomerase-2